MAKNGWYKNPAFSDSLDISTHGIDDKPVPENTPSDLRSPRRYRSTETLVAEDRFGGVSRSSSRSKIVKENSEETELINTRSGSPGGFVDRDGDDPKNPRTMALARQSKLSGIWILIFFLSIFSTAFSLVFFLIAVAKPRYRNYIHASGKLSPTTASLLSAIFAKAIEISFVTVFTTFIGQALSKRALRQKSKGVTIANMLMKGWVYQPGSMLTSFAGVRHAGLTALGAASLCVALFVTFYTTAAESLVSPKLRFGNYLSQNLQGVVSLTYANSTALASRCPAIISSSMDGPMNGSAIPVSQSTCYKVHNSYQPLRDFTFFTDSWKSYRLDDSIPRNELNRRPTGWTTVGYEKYHGDWLDISGLGGVNNVTLAMPHGGVVPSVRDVKLNGIVQPEAQSDFGNVDITASVASPAINVICYNLNATTVQYFLASSNGRRQGSLDPKLQEIFKFDPKANETTAQSNSNMFLAPLFAVAPAAFNVAIFSSAGYDDPSMYILTGANSTEPRYGLCALRSFLTSSCSTSFLSATGGGNVTVNCNPDNPEALIRFLPGANDTYQNQFKDISTELSYALSLNVEDAPLSRILGIFASSIPIGEFNPNLPSLAEALAVLFSNSLVLSSVGAQFGSSAVSNSYPGVIAYPLTLPTTETFHVRVRTVEYASGVPHGWQASFYVVLAGVLVTNIFCLVYFLGTKDVVFDLTEIENLFCVAFNSTPMKMEDGFRGTGLKRGDFNMVFYADTDRDRFHLYRGE